MFIRFVSKKTKKKLGIISTILVTFFLVVTILLRVVVEMGLLVVGTPLSWNDSKKYHAHVKRHGIVQFLNIWKALKDKKWSQFLWGDEVEAMLVVVDHDQKVARMCIRAAEVCCCYFIIFLLFVFLFFFEVFLFLLRLFFVFYFFVCLFVCFSLSFCPPTSFSKVLEQLEAAEEQLSAQHFTFNAHFVPEYGSFMVEATPARPYGGYTTDLR